MSLFMICTEKLTFHTRAVITF